LRLLGVDANATERAVRSESRNAKTGIYCATLRGASSYVCAQAETVAKELVKGSASFGVGKHTLIETWRQIDIN
jgi:hypothetical protein